jgi:hypothetical protein
MNLKITVESDNKDFCMTQTRSLKNWIDNENEEIRTLLLKKEILKEDAGAGLVENIIAITLGAPSIIVLARSLHVWLKEKTKQKLGEVPKMNLRIESENGKVIEINVENAGKTEEALIKSLCSLT